MPTDGSKVCLLNGPYISVQSGPALSGNLRTVYVYMYSHYIRAAFAFTDTAVAPGTWYTRYTIRYQVRYSSSTCVPNGSRPLRPGKKKSICSLMLVSYVYYIYVRLVRNRKISHRHAPTRQMIRDRCEWGYSFVRATQTYE